MPLKTNRKLAVNSDARQEGASRNPGTGADETRHDLATPMAEDRPKPASVLHCINMSNQVHCVFRSLCTHNADLHWHYDHFLQCLSYHGLTILHIIST